MNFTILSHFMFPYLLTPFLTAASFVESEKEALYHKTAHSECSGSTYTFSKDPLCEHSRLGAIGVGTAGAEE